MSTEHWDLDQDNTLGGNSPSPNKVSSQKALKEYIDSQSGGGSSTDVQINGTSITNQGVANIVTNSAYDASSNKIATMSDLPTDKIFIATYGVTTLADIITAFNAGKLVYCINNAVVSYLYTLTSTFASFTTPMTSEGGVTWFIRRATKWESGYNSFANTRFDGQWVASFSTLSTSGSKGTHTISLSNYLPNDSYKYDVCLNINMYYNGVSEAYLYSDLLTTGTSDSYSNYVLRTSTDSRMGSNRFYYPVGTGRTITYVIGTNAPSSFALVAIGYRRIGTNS